MSRNVQRKSKARRQGNQPPRMKANAIDALIAGGLQRHQAGEPHEAERLYREALRIDPQHPDALHLLGVLAQQSGQHVLAAELIEQALKKKGDQPSIYIHLGNALRDQGRTCEAIDSYRQALQLQPDSAEAYNQLGATLQQQGAFATAILHFQEAVRLQPNRSDAHYNLGRIYQVQGELDKAREHYHKALVLTPDFAEAHNNLGTILQRQGDLETAIIHFQEAIRIKPALAEAHNNLSMSLKEQGSLPAAITHYQEAITLQPHCAEAYYNLGNALQQQGAVESAIACYQEAIAVQPEFSEAQWNLGLALLLIGRFDAGWAQYEWRFRRPGIAYPTIQRPQWQGEPFRGKTLLVWAEQGYGDTLFFIRYLPDVKARGGRVVVACQPMLARLLQDCEGIDAIVTDTPETLAPEQYDLHVPLLSLPRLFATNAATIPAMCPYVRAHPTLVQQWQERLKPDGQLRIGLVWAGNAAHPNDHNRSCALSDFAGLASVRDVIFYSLQKGPAAAQALDPPSGMHLTDLSHDLHDFAETAAVVANLDLVMTVDTAVAHLAGAMGRPVWTLLPYGPDWRWMLDRHDSPWYPTMRLWRQTEPGNWADVCRRIARALQDVRPDPHLPASRQTPLSVRPNPPLPNVVNHRSPARSRQTLRPTVLFSTTRMWNPGDDFILFGIRNLLRPLIGPFNTMVYNRHPDLHHMRLHFNQPATITAAQQSIEANLYELLQPHLIPRDNSWHAGIDLQAIDLAVFAGTPEWLGSMVAPLVERLIATRIPTLYLGIGAFEGTAGLCFEQLPIADRILLRRANLITVRDETCGHLLAPLHPFHLPCPALFAAPDSRQRQSKKRLALSTQGIRERNGQRIDPLTRDYSIALFKALAQRYECSLVCHYADELAELRPYLGQEMAFCYAYDARDYLSIYDHFDLTVTTRVHGAGLCASLGIPAFVISHSVRSDTAQGFLAEILHPQHDTVDQAVERIEHYDVVAASAQLYQHKEAIRDRYIALLTPVIQQAGRLSELSERGSHRS